MVLTYYGGGKVACIQCGFSDARGLCIDHINNNAGGNKRKKLGLNFYRQLKRSGFPPGYQTLCANCNQIKEAERRRQTSPHNRK